jgi:16S rRNA processing protein RimM
MAETAHLGTIVKTVGLKGEVKLAPGPDFWPDALHAESLAIVSDDEVERSVHVESYRPSGRAFVLKLTGISSVDGARSLVGRSLELPLDMLGDVSLPEEALPCQFMGLTVRLVDGSTLGVVVDMLLGPAQDCLIVEGGGERYLVPNVPGLVVRTNLEEGFMEIDPPEGLLDLRW